MVSLELSFKNQRYFQQLYLEWAATRKSPRGSAFKKHLEKKYGIVIDIVGWYRYSNHAPMHWRRICFTDEIGRTMFLITHAGMDNE